MLRIGLFLLTNLGVMLIFGVMMKVLGLEQLLAQAGVHANTISLLLFCALFGFGGSLVSLFLSKMLARRSTGTQLIETPRSSDERWLLETVEQLAAEAGIKMPQVGIFPAQGPNAFATGWNRNDALVAVSSGLLQRFPRNEVRAVMAHEIGHVANGDMVTLALIQGVVNTFVMFFARIIGQLVDRVVFKNERGQGMGFWIATLFAEMVLGVLASIIVAWFSRFREYRADAAGARLASANDMAAALQRLLNESRGGADAPLPGELKAFGISGGLHNLFATHPPLERRIAALREQA